MEDHHGPSNRPIRHSCVIFFFRLLAFEPPLVDIFLCLHGKHDTGHDTYISHKVLNGIFGLREFTKTWFGMRVIAKYLDGKWDLTTNQETGFNRIWAQDVGFSCLSVVNSGIGTS